MRKDCMMEGAFQMKGRRWHPEEDQLLKETVLKTIQNGGTQLKAFAEVGKKLNRTPGACGFRWNAVLRKNDPVSYQEAKRKRVYNHLEKRKELQIDTFEQVIQILQKVDQEWKQLNREVNRISQSVSQKKKEYQELQRENQSLRQAQLSLHAYRREVKERYQELLQMFTSLREQMVGTNKKREFPRIDAESEVDS